VQLSAWDRLFKWNLDDNGMFSVGSMYKTLIPPEVTVDNNNKNWNIKAHLKIKNFD
jgi:hypothetical protein